MSPSGRAIALSLACLVALVLGGAGASGSSEQLRSDTAVLDRFEGESATLMFDNSRERMTVDRSALPPAGRHANAVFDVSREDGTSPRFRYDGAATRERAHRSQSRFDRLVRSVNGSTSA